MKLNDLKKAAAKARQDLKLAGIKAAKLRRTAKAAKVIAEQARLKHKRARKAAKQTKHLALAAEEQVQERLRICEKAQKRLAKALKKAEKAKKVGRQKPVRAKAHGSRKRPRSVTSKPVPPLLGKPVHAKPSSPAPSTSTTPTLSGAAA